MWVCPQCHLVFKTRLAVCPLHGSSLVEQEFDPLVGRTIDRYQILERLGVGAMGTVYRARHAVLDRQCAIKVLFGDFAHDENLRKRFEREARAVSRMGHVNVVEVLDFGANRDGLTFLVMEFVDGRPLDRIVDSEAPLSPARVAQIASQIAAGLGEAHSQGFVHRDMKPPNVIVSGPVGSEKVKVLDFGLVSLLYKKIDMERLTIEGQLVGTPLYMSPEQTLDAAVGPASDLYSLGVMMYEMLTGRPPFLETGRIALMFAHVHQTPVPPPPSGGLERVIMRLMEKKPEDRYESALAVFHAIEALQLGDDGHSKDLEFRDRTNLDKAPAVFRDTDPSLPPNEDDHEFIDGETEVEEISESLPPKLRVLMIEGAGGGSSDSIGRMDHEFKVRSVPDVSSAQVALRHEVVDAIIANATLPELQSLENLLGIRAMAPRTPLIVISSRAPETLALEAARYGADELLSSATTTPVALARTVRFAVARSRAQAAMEDARPKPTIEIPSMVSMVRPVSRVSSRAPEPRRSVTLVIVLALGLFALGITTGVLGVVATGDGSSIDAHPTWEFKSSPSGATVVVDGVAIGKTPLSIPRPSKKRTIEVTLRKPGYATWTKKFESQDGPVVIDALLEARP